MAGANWFNSCELCWISGLCHNLLCSSWQFRKLHRNKESLIYNLDPVKMYHNSPLVPQGTFLTSSVCSCLNVSDMCQEGDHRKESGPGHALQHRPATEMMPTCPLNFVRYSITFNTRPAFVEPAKGFDDLSIQLCNFPRLCLPRLIDGIVWRILSQR